MARGHVVRVFRVKMSENMANGLEELVKEGCYVSYADALRHALNLLLKENREQEFRLVHPPHEEIQRERESSSNKSKTPFPLQ